MHFLRGSSTLSRIRGFTLIELIACIIIIAILSAVAGPAMFDNTPFSQRGYADEVASAIRYANNLAAGSNCNVAVTLTATDYHVYQQRRAANCKAVSGFTLIAQRIDGGAMTNTAPANVTLSPATQIIFDNQGRIISGTTSLIVGTHAINIDPVTGMVTVQ